MRDGFLPIKNIERRPIFGILRFESKSRFKRVFGDVQSPVAEGDGGVVVFSGEGCGGLELVDAACSGQNAEPRLGFN